MNVAAILEQSDLNNNILTLPNVQLDRKDYLAFKKAMDGIGGKWKGGKTQGFVFKNDPAHYIKQLKQGDEINLKKEYQAFFTPAEVADHLIALADPKIHHKILEPSAGQGALIDALVKYLDGSFPFELDACELMQANREVLYSKSHKINLLPEENFLNNVPQPKYDRIIANPPFTKNQDIDHILHMFKFLVPGGILVSISSKHWTFSTGQKEENFRHFLTRNKAVIHVLPKGAFKTSGTMIETVIIVLRKEESNG